MNRNWLFYLVFAVFLGNFGCESDDDGNNFSITVVPSTITVQSGSSSGASVLASGEEGITVSLSASAPAGITVNFGGNLRTGSSQSVSVAASSAVASGTHSIVIEGRAGGMSSSATLTVNVTGTTGSGDFLLNVSPQTVSVQRGNSASVSLNSTAIGSSSQISLALISTSGITGFFNPSSISAGSGSVLTIFADANAAVGTHNITVRGSAGTIVREVQLTVNVTSSPVGNEFFLSLGQSSISIQRGTIGNISVSISSSGIPQSVNLTLLTPVTNITGSFNPTVVTGSGTSTLTIAPDINTPVGTYLVTINGTSENLVRSVTLSVVVTESSTQNNFSVAVFPSNISVPPGGSAAVTLTISIIAGNAQTVTVSTPNLPSGIGATYNSTMQSGSSQTLTLNAGSGVPHGTYNLIVRGTSGTIVHETTFAVNVTGVSQNDFSLSLSNTTLTLPQNTAGSVNVTTSLTSGFLQNITLAVSAPFGVISSFNPPTLTTGGTSVLTINPDGLAAGTYIVVVTGTSSSTVKSASLNLIVTSGGTACDRLCLTPVQTVTAVCWHRFQPGVQTMGPTVVTGGTTVCCPGSSVNPTGAFTVPSGFAGTYTGNAGSCTSRSFEIIDFNSGAYGGKK